MGAEREARRTTRRHFLAGAGSLASVALLGSCGGDGNGDRTPAPTMTASPTGGTLPSPTSTAVASPTQEPPSVAEMAGEMLILGFRGTDLATDNPIVADLRQGHAGGVVLFSVDLPSGGGPRNVKSPEQVAALTRALRETAGRKLLIGIDEEGGQVARLGPANGFPATRSAAELGRLDDVNVTSAAAAGIAQTLSSAGINLNFAPVVDLNTNPSNPIIGQLDRSFGVDPALVARHAAAVIAAHRRAGILTCLKHFPGHGSSTADSHLGFVDITDTWSRAELEPFRTLIDEGQVGMVMAGHLFNAKLDPTYPASLSRATITGLLRGELGFDGVVVTDDMQMGAITRQYGFEEAVRLAIVAGNDLLIFGNNLDTFDPDLGRRAIDAIVRLVDQGELPRERVGESYRRIQALKAGLA